jgi:putative solute:sodium symporter small subunit
VEPSHEGRAEGAVGGAETVTEEAKRAYWRANLRLMVILLTIWATVSFVFGILLVDVLDQVTIGSFPLGFWFAQQGSILTFVVLIAVYAWRMDKLDERHGLREGRGSATPGEVR